MHWWQAALLGAAGGTLAEVLALFRYFGDWQAARRSPAGTVRQAPAALAVYVDVPAHAWMLVLRAVLGAASAAAFTGEIKGAYVAVALGLSGPTVLARLGEVPQVDALLNRGPGTPDGSGTPDGPGHRSPAAGLPAPVRGRDTADAADAAPEVVRER